MIGSSEGPGVRPGTTVLTDPALAVTGAGTAAVQLSIVPAAGPALAAARITDQLPAPEVQEAALAAQVARGTHHLIAHLNPSAAAAGTPRNLKYRLGTVNSNKNLTIIRNITTKGTER